MGNLLESLLSFALVSYYLVVGTVSFDPDVERPSPFVYLTWAASFLGMVYKGCSIYLRDEEGEHTLNEIPWVIVCGILVFMSFMLFALLPAFLVAEARNEFWTSLCPEAISSNVAAVYFIIWGLPLTIDLIFVSKCIPNTDVREGFCVFVILVYCLWLSMTHISIHIYGTFRTDIGLLLCWPGTIAAVVLFVFSSFALIYILLCAIGNIAERFKRCRN